MTNTGHGPRMHSKTVKKAFHQLKKRTVWTMRLRCAALINFSGKGYFYIDALMQILGGYGYGTSREARSVVLDALRAAPGWFTETRPGYFTFKSERRVLGFTRGDGNHYNYDETLLHKKNARRFTDVLINIAASGQMIAADNLVNQTGYRRARIFDALRRGRLYGFDRVKIMVPVPGMVYAARLDALKAAGETFWDNEQLATVMLVNGSYAVMMTVGLCFNGLRDMASDGDGATDALKNVSRAMPSTVKRTPIRSTTVFDIMSRDILTGVDAFTMERVRYVQGDFVSVEAGNAFLQRHHKKPAEKRSALAA